MILPFGKYKGYKLVKVAQEDPKYLIWMKKNLDLNGGLSWGVNYYVDLIEKGVKIEEEKKQKGKYASEDLPF